MSSPFGYAENRAQIALVVERPLGLKRTHDGVGEKPPTPSEVGFFKRTTPFKLVTALSLLPRARCEMLPFGLL
jgi:hypothetical protein